MTSLLALLRDLLAALVERVSARADARWHAEFERGAL